MFLALESVRVGLGPWPIGPRLPPSCLPFVLPELALDLNPELPPVCVPSLCSELVLLELPPAVLPVCAPRVASCCAPGLCFQKLE